MKLLYWVTDSDVNQASGSNGPSACVVGLYRFDAKVIG
jgi:hypothetical protein